MSKPTTTEWWGIALFVPLILLWAFATRTIWQWSLVEHFGLRPLPLHQAVILAQLWGILAYRYIPVPDDEDTKNARLLSLIVVPLIALAVAAIARWLGGAA